MGAVEAVTDVLMVNTVDGLLVVVTDTLIDGRAEGVGMIKTIGAVEVTVDGVLPAHTTSPVFAIKSSTRTFALRDKRAALGNNEILATGSFAKFATEKTIQLSESEAVEQPSRAVPIPSMHTLHRVFMVQEELDVHGWPIARSPPMSCTP